MHVKTIKGKKYYYESKRVGKKVTSVYIGPVGKVGHSAPSEHYKQELVENEDSGSEEDFYVG